MIGPGFIGALDGNMLSIYTANTIWKLPDIFEPFADCSQISVIGSGK